MQLIQVIFFCHCLAPLEADLTDSGQAFLEYFNFASIYLCAAAALASCLALVAAIGATSLSLGRLALSRLCSTIVCLGLVDACLVVG